MAREHIDLTDPGNFLAGVPHAWFRELRREEPVYWHPEADGPGFWCVTRHDDLRFVSRNPELFSSEAAGTALRDPEDAEALMRSRAIMLNMDPPKHVKYRRIVQRGFTPNRIAAQRPYLERLARRIVEPVARKGECEFVVELACELPLQVICEMMGVPQDERHRIFDLTNIMIGADDPDFASSREDGKRAGEEIFGYAHRLAQRYKQQPGDDLTSLLLHAEVEGEALSDLDYCSFFLLLLIAGNETTRTVTVNGFRTLIEHPEQLRMLVDDPGLIPGAVEEILRYEPAVIHFRRTATRDVELRGRKIRRGDKLAIWYPSANRDEEVFPEPDRFDITRRENPHLAFGIGEHYCLGANLARLELQVIFGELIRRLREPELLAEPRRLRSNFINGVKEMRVGFRPEA
jgi:cholest-4-en-3-one 26-monooxygenase